MGGEAGYEITDAGPAMLEDSSVGFEGRAGHEGGVEVEVADGEADGGTWRVGSQLLLPSLVIFPK